MIIDTETYYAKSAQINTSNAHSYLKIFPNPNDGSFAIEFENADWEELAQVEVFDIQGKKIYSSDLNKEQINYITIPQISKGMYFIKINFGQNLIYSDKIEVIH